eukprot:TRINITY_DN75029_c0_g1_i1.p1 TRINITY_DN75029_c0_g1~~TRINITY_DN75029_c0_g1_i1.p1  ORF type:complete len:934 (-),score=119.59 TRINITY_DN75029_c0_g1_i1:69-2870(-)
MRVGRIFLACFHDACYLKSRYLMDFTPAIFAFAYSDQDHDVHPTTSGGHIHLSSGENSGRGAVFGSALPLSSLTPLQPALLPHAASVPPLLPLKPFLRSELGLGKHDILRDVAAATSMSPPLERAIAPLDDGTWRPVEYADSSQPGSAEDNIQVVQGQSQYSTFQQQVVTQHRGHDKLSKDESSCVNPENQDLKQEVQSTAKAQAQRLSDTTRIGVTAEALACIETRPTTDAQPCVTHMVDQAPMSQASHTLRISNLEQSSIAQPEDIIPSAEPENDLGADQDVAEVGNHRGTEPQLLGKGIASCELTSETSPPVGAESTDASGMLQSEKEELIIQPNMEYSTIQDEALNSNTFEKKSEPQALEIEAPHLAAEQTAQDAARQTKEMFPQPAKYIWLASYVSAISIVAGIWAFSVALHFGPGEMLLGGIWGASEISLAAAIYAICRPGLNLRILRPAVAVMGSVCAALYAWAFNLELPWPIVMSYVWPLTVGISKYLALPAVFCFQAAPLPSTCLRTNLQALPVNLLAGLTATVDIVVSSILKMDIVGFATNCCIILIALVLTSMRKMKCWKDPDGFHLGYAVALVWAHNIPAFLLTIVLNLGDLAADLAEGQEVLKGFMDSGLIYCAQGLIMILSFCWEQTAAQVSPRGTNSEFESTDALVLTFGLRLTAPLVLQGFVLKAPAMGGTYFIMLTCTSLMNVTLMSGALPLLVFKLQPHFAKVVQIIKASFFCCAKDVELAKSGDSHTRIDKFLYICVRHLRSQAVQLLAQAAAFVVCLVTVASECLVSDLMGRPECCELLGRNESYESIDRKMCLGRDAIYVVKDIREANCPRFTARHTHDSRFLLLGNYAIQVVMFISCALLAVRVFHYLASRLKSGMGMTSQDEKLWDSFVSTQNAIQYVLRFRFFILAVALHLVPFDLNVITRNTYGKFPF